MSDDEHGHRSGDFRPVPDPTLLTTAALNREIAATKEALSSDLAAFRVLLEEKLLSVDTHFKLIERQRAEQKQDSRTAIEAALSASKDSTAEFADRYERRHVELSTATQVALDKFGSLVDEKFVSVNTQFELIERQRVEQKADTKAAVDAALAAAKEAVKEQTTASDRSITKSETATSEQLKQMNVTFTTAIQGISQPISDLKDRVTALESIRLGGFESRGESRDSRADSRGGIAIAVASVSAIMTIIMMAIELLVLHH